MPRRARRNKRNTRHLQPSDVPVREYVDFTIEILTGLFRLTFAGPVFYTGNTKITYRGTNGQDSPYPVTVEEITPGVYDLGFDGGQGGGDGILIPVNDPGFRTSSGGYAAPGIHDTLP